MRRTGQPVENRTFLDTVTANGEVAARVAKGSARAATYAAAAGLLLDQLGSFDVFQDRSAKYRRATGWSRSLGILRYAFGGNMTVGRQLATPVEVDHRGREVDGIDYPYTYDTLTLQERKTLRRGHPTVTRYVITRSFNVPGNGESPPDTLTNFAGNNSMWRPESYTDGPDDPRIERHLYRVERFGEELVKLANAANVDLSAPPQAA